MAKKVTIREFQKQFSAFISKKVAQTYSKAFQQRIITSFNKIKREMIAEFKNHPVTVEIKAGPFAENSSGTLGGYGNLFSFIGFDEGDNPTDNIEGLLNLTRIEYNRETKDGFIMTIYLPSKQEIFSETPMPWASGRSWAEGIERGISGFGQYLNTESISSRSGEGIETNSVIRRGKFKNTPYISALMNKYLKRFQQINNSVVVSGIL
jgi:hypothetical protein